MSQDDVQKQAKTSNERQKELKARRVADGFKHTTVWIHAETEDESPRIL